MARKFSHPEIKTLEVGETASIYDTAPEVLQRRVDGYAKRAGRKFICTYEAAHRFNDYGITIRGHNVTRLPDPEPQP